jgi:hypothetical protein
VLLARREPDHVARPDLLDRPAPALRQPAAGGHDERLAERVGVPRRPCAGLERNAGPDHARRIGRLEQWIDTHGAAEVLGRPLAGQLRAASLDVHDLNSFTS